MKTGYDRYLEFQYRQSGDFFRNLFQAISHADTKNTEKLSKGFPEEVDAVRLWTHSGAAALAKKVTPGHPLLDDLREEYDL